MRITRRQLFGALAGGAVAKHVPVAKPVSVVMDETTWNRPIHKVGDTIHIRKPARFGEPMLEKLERHTITEQAEIVKVILDDTTKIRKPLPDRVGMTSGA